MYHKWEMLERIHYVCDQQMGCNDCVMCEFCPHEEGDPIRAVYNYTNEQLKLIDDEYVRLKNQAGEIASSMKTEEMISKAVDEAMVEMGEAAEKTTKVMKELIVSANSKQASDNFESADFMFDGREGSGALELNELFAKGWKISDVDFLKVNGLDFVYYRLRK